LQTAAEVVAEQVDDHDVFRHGSFVVGEPVALFRVFRVGEARGGQCLFMGRVEMCFRRRCGKKELGEKERVRRSSMWTRRRSDGFGLR